MTNTDLKKTSSSSTEIISNLPSKEFALPIIPLRQGILFPYTESVLTFGRSFSVNAIKEAIKSQNLVVLVSQKKPDIEQPKEKDLYQVGVLATVERTLKSDNNLSALVKGVARVKIHHYLQQQPFLKARVSKMEEEITNDQEEMALTAHLKKTFQQIVQMGKPVEFLNFIKLMSTIDASEMTDQIAATLNLNTIKKQDLLETTNIKQRIKKIIQYLNHETKVLEIEKDVVHKTQEKFDKHMRENILRERLNTIKKELGEYEDSEDIAGSFQERLTKINLPQEAKEKVQKEIQRLENMSPNNPETGYVRTWLDTIFEIPWKSAPTKKISIKKAQKQLDKSHYGLNDVKERVLEYLAVLQLKSQRSDTAKKVKKSSINNPNSKTSLPTILCFVGPPGVGKTSIGQAIAQALGRKFAKISLGGIRDEAEIRGHRRTYVGAMPGRIIKGIITAHSKNPVFILDEIDKVGADFRGDPSAALLEVLDPEQNHSFEDHYLDIAYDLSEVIFITTANTLDTVPPALRDRLEIINYPGYTYNEKFQIAKNHLLGKVLEDNALEKTQLDFSPTALKKVIQRYTREAGVRELERKLGKIARKIAKELVSNQTVTSSQETKKISATRVRKLLGPEEYDPTLAEEISGVGVATGLAWTSAGGDLLFIEVALTPGKGKIILTGKLGEVMQESAQAALTFVKSHATELKIDNRRFDKTDVHIHVPEGATPKDGPSAGITLATAITSAFTQRAVPRNLAMTGEITLRGRILRIGGLKEKAIAAHLAGIKRVIIPQDNERNIEEIPDEVKRDIKFIPVANASEVLKIALEKPVSKK
jgi:ATP-dependent Lon protease